MSRQLLFRRKQKTDFYELLEQHAMKVFEAYRTLVNYLDKNDTADPERIFFLEREADDIRRVLIDRLNRTLITPFDREDIFALSRAIDDIIDAAKSTIEELRLFKIQASEELLLKAKILQEGTLEIYDALKNLRKHPNVAMEHAKRAKATENQMNILYLESLAQLFDNEKNTPSFMLKMRELYRHLKRSANRCDEAANIISDIIVKS
jgi:uncharacterized protein Yka (UPF0111/DUF47 family)